jgi:hypothetical protein
VTPSSRTPVRLEYRDPAGAAVTVATDPARFRALAARLEREGRPGELVLVDGASGRLMVRRRLAPTPSVGAGPSGS